MGCAPSKAEGAKEAASEEAQAGADTADWLEQAPEIVDIAETKECDLLIVGADNGGIAASAYAAD